MSFSIAHLLLYNQLTTQGSISKSQYILKLHIYRKKEPKKSLFSHQINNKSKFDKVSIKLCLMEMDIGADNYPFQCFLCFLMLKLHPSFQLTTITHKSCTLSHNLSHKRKIYLFFKETFYKISFQNKILHPNTGEVKLAQ